MLENDGATPEVETPETPEPQSMDDTIRETLRALQDKGNTGLEPETPTDTPQTPEEKAARIRDGKGKFTTAPVIGENAPVVGAPVETPVTPEWKAPSSWRPTAAAKLATADPEIRAEVEKREADMHKGIESYRQYAEFGSSVEKAISPFIPTMQKLGLHPVQAIQSLMQADYRLRNGTPQEKSQYLTELMASYGITPQDPNDQPYVDPNYQALEQRLNQLQGNMQQRTMMEEQQRANALNSDIATFAADPSHPHFEVAKPHMIALLQAGQAKDLQDAYDQAVYANPATRSAMLQQHTQQTRDEATKKAQEAKRLASVNVRSKPSLPSSAPVGTMDETIRATLRKLQSA